MLPALVIVRCTVLSVLVKMYYLYVVYRMDCYYSYSTCYEHIYITSGPDFLKLVFEVLIFFSQYK